MKNHPPLITKVSPDELTCACPETTGGPYGNAGPLCMRPAAPFPGCRARAEPTEMQSSPKLERPSFAPTFRWIEGAARLLKEVWKSSSDIESRWFEETETLLSGVPVPNVDLGFDSPADRAARAEHPSDKRGSTPRTDAVWKAWHLDMDDNERIDQMTDHACQLERELADAIKAGDSVQRDFNEYRRVHSSATTARADQVLKDAEEAINLFLEYRDQHGHSEESAKAAALNEFAEAEHYDKT